MYDRIEWYDGRMNDVVSDCNATAAAKPDKHITRAVAITCTDGLVRLHLVDLTFCVATALWTLAATSFSSCLQACSRA